MEEREKVIKSFFGKNGALNHICSQRGFKLPEYQFRTKSIYEDIAKEYLKLIEALVNKDSIQEFYNSTNNNTNIVSLSINNSSLIDITKNSIAIFDRSIVNSNSNNFISYHSQYHYPKTINAKFVDFESLESLGKYIYDCKELFHDDILFFLPTIKSGSRITGGAGSDFTSSNFTTIFDAIIENQKIAEMINQNPVKNKFIRSLLTLEIPVIQNKDLSIFSKLIVNERNEFEDFKIYMREKILEIDTKKETENILTEYAKLNLHMKKELSYLKKDFHNLKRKKTFQLTSSSIISVTASLVLIDSNILKTISGLLGVSGGLYSFIETLKQNDIEKSNLKRNPYYFLWILENQKEK